MSEFTAQGATRRPYRRPIARSWWLEKSYFTKYMIRELTSVFVCLYSLILLLGLYRLGQGQEAFDAWVAGICSFPSVVLHLMILGFALFHAITWFAIAPQAMPLQIGDQKVPEKPIVIGHWIGSAVLSLLVLILFVAL